MDTAEVDELCATSLQLLKSQTLYRRCSHPCFDKCSSFIISNISCQNSYEQQIQTITRAEGKEFFLLLFLMVTVGNEEVSCACNIPFCGWKKIEIRCNFFLPSPIKLCHTNKTKKIYVFPESSQNISVLVCMCIL